MPFLFFIFPWGLFVSFLSECQATAWVSKQTSSSKNDVSENCHGLGMSCQALCWANDHCWVLWELTVSNSGHFFRLRTIWSNSCGCRWFHDVLGFWFWYVDHSLLIINQSVFGLPLCCKLLSLSCKQPNTRQLFLLKTSNKSSKMYF